MYKYRYVTVGQVNIYNSKELMFVCEKWDFRLNVHLTVIKYANLVKNPYWVITTVVWCVLTNKSNGFQISEKKFFFKLVFLYLASLHLNWRWN